MPSMAHHWPLAICTFPNFGICVWSLTVRQILHNNENQQQNCGILISGTYLRIQYFSFQTVLDVAVIGVGRFQSQTSSFNASQRRTVQYRWRSTWWSGIRFGCYQHFDAVAFLFQYDYYQQYMSISLSLTQMHTSVNGVVMKTINFNCTNFNALLWLTKTGNYSSRSFVPFVV